MTKRKKFIEWVKYMDKFIVNLSYDAFEGSNLKSKDKEDAREYFYGKVVKKEGTKSNLIKTT